MRRRVIRVVGRECPCDNNDVAAEARVVYVEDRVVCRTCHLIRMALGLYEGVTLRKFSLTVYACRR